MTHPAPVQTTLQPPKRLAYADPPYPGRADRYLENEEVDHVALIQKLREYDGWALSTDEKNLRYVLGLCPEGTRVLAWCRPNVAPFTPYPYRGQKPRGFCDWVLRCLGATPEDTLEDLFPGSGIMGIAFEAFRQQMTLSIPRGRQQAGARAEANRLRKTHEPLPGFNRRASVPEDADFYRKST